MGDGHKNGVGVLSYEEVVVIICSDFLYILLELGDEISTL